MDRFGEIRIRRKIDCEDLIETVREMLQSMFQEKVFEQAHITDDGIIITNEEDIMTAFYVGRNLTVLFGYNKYDWISCISIRYRKQWLRGTTVIEFDKNSLTELVNLIIGYTGGTFHGSL